MKLLPPGCCAFKRSDKKNVNEKITKFFIVSIQRSVTWNNREIFVNKFGHCYMHYNFVLVKDAIYLHDRYQLR